MWDCEKRLNSRLQKNRAQLWGIRGNCSAQLGDGGSPSRMWGTQRRRQRVAGIPGGSRGGRFLSDSREVLYVELGGDPRATFSKIEGRKQ